MSILAKNKRATFDYEIVEEYEGGLALLGTEVKSIRDGNISLNGAFVTLHDDQVWLTNATVPPWQPKNTADDYDPTRSRKILLKSEEIKELIGLRESKGLTIVPLRVYTKGPYIKISIAVARGKRQHDKKEAKRERDIKRDAERLLRGKDPG